MRKALPLAIGVLQLLAVAAAWSEEPRSQDPAPWQVQKVWKSDDARLKVEPKAPGDSPPKYLHVQLEFSPGIRDRKLHQFRIIDRRGKTVGELHGFYKTHSLLVFEGKWLSLQGRYLEGLGHREPLFHRQPTAPALKTKSLSPGPASGTKPARGSMPELPPPAKTERVRATAPQARHIPAAERKSTARGITESIPRQAKPDSREAEAYPGRPVLLEWKLNERQAIYQEVLVTQKSNYRIQGLDMASNVRYSVLSSFTVQKRNPDGTSVVQHKVEATRLLQADPLVRAVFGDLLQKLIGATFKLTLSPQMEIIAFEGQQETIRAAAGGNPLDGQSLLLASLVDPDGWKELDQLSLFQPGKPLQLGEKWERELTHHWGPLGAWQGKVYYAYLGKQDGLHRISYKLELDHLSPESKTRGPPPQIVDAAFKHQEAGGTIYFDSDQKRVSRAEERFHVKGTMAIELLGKNTPVELEEDQTFRIRIFQQKPWPQ